MYEAIVENVEKKEKERNWKSANLETRLNKDIGQMFLVWF
jgi:hypothetical protein